MVVVGGEATNAPYSSGYVRGAVCELETQEIDIANDRAARCPDLHLTKGFVQPNIVKDAGGYSRDRASGVHQSTDSGFFPVFCVKQAIGQHGPYS